MANATYSTGLYVNYGSAALYLDIYETTDAANNRSLIRGVLTLAHSGSGSPFNNNASSASMTIAGNTWGWSGGYNLPGNSSLTLIDQSVWVGHDANGAGTVSASGSFSGNGNFPIGSGSTSGTYTMADFDRRPAAPTFASTVRTVNSFAVSLNATSSPAGTPTYIIQRSENSGSWGDQRNSQSTTYSGLTQGSTQQFRAAASNTDGTSGWTYSSTFTIPTVPSAPAAINVASVNGLDVTVNISNSASNGGSTITGYTMEYNNGSGWTGSTAVVNGSVTYTNLTPGLTYQFRAYATNEMGNSAYATSTPVFVSSGGRRWNGTSFTPTTTAKRWNGTSWVNLTIGKRWNGSSWVNLQ